MKLAMPVANGRLVSPLGNAEYFDIVEVDLVERRGLSAWRAVPERRGGVQLAEWLVGEGVDLVIVAELGAKERGLLEGRGLRVLAGAPRNTPREIVRSYLQDKLEEPAITMA